MNVVDKPNVRGGIHTVTTDKTLDVAARLAEMREWVAEWRCMDADLQSRAQELDPHKPLDSQIIVQIKNLHGRLQVLQLKWPLEISPAAFAGAGGYAELRGTLAEQFARLSKEDRLFWLDNLKFIMTPDLRLLDDKVTSVRQYSAFGQQRNFLLGGDSGMGKSTYTNYLTAHNLPIVEARRTRIVVIKADAPVGNNGTRALLQRLLSECGASFSKRETEEELLMRLIIYLDRCGVELIIIDECEHITRPILRRRLLEISNLAHGVPIICASCQPHLWTHGDVEVAGRWGDYFRLMPYKGERLAELLTFVELLLPFTGDSYLDAHQLPMSGPGGKRTGFVVGPAAFIEAKTGGILRDIMVLIYEASKRAITRDLPCISPALLSETWARLVTIQAVTPENDL